MSLLSDYSDEVKKNLPNDYDNNWDYLRYGPERKSHVAGKLRSLVANFTGRKKYRSRKMLQSFSDKVPFFEFLYNNLYAENDKKLLVKVMAYHALGHRRVRLPLNTPGYWKNIKYVDTLIDKSDFINAGSGSVNLYKTDVTELGFPIKLYFSGAGIIADFIIKQYEYNNSEIIIKADAGDFVIDCGGCWGDTAIYFANEVGDEGKVFSLEFIPGNVSVFEKNVSLNDAVKRNIELIKRPVWNDSLTKLYFKDRGPGSRVEVESFGDMEGAVTSISIDDLIREKEIKKIDFIKMDIEGAEIPAITGASETIRRFKPKLAIALYHDIRDFERVPVLIKSIVPEYKLFFSHNTIHTEESILFAKV